METPSTPPLKSNPNPLLPATSNPLSFSEETTLASPSPASLSSPRPRWLSLSTYKSVPISWDWETELEAEVEEALTFSSSSSSSSASEEDFDFGNDEEEIFSEGGKEGERILTVLKCYLFNLEQGMLVTGSKVDERVEAALLRLTGKEVLSASGSLCRQNLVSEGALWEGKESWEISDEERVVVEIEVFVKLVKGKEMPDEVAEVVKEILRWAKVNGTVRGGESEEGMMASRASLEIVGC